jgi:hypothetical protein
MPVSGEPGLITKLTGGSKHERESDPVIEYRTARPGPSLMTGPPSTLASTLACWVGRPGRILKTWTTISARNWRTGVSALHGNCRFGTSPHHIPSVAVGMSCAQAARRSTDEQGPFVRRHSLHRL